MPRRFPSNPFRKEIRMSVQSPEAVAGSPRPTAAIRADLEANPGSALEDVAARTGTTPAEVLAALPEGEALCLPGSLFVEVMDEIAGWGEITLVMNTGDVILEAKGELPKGSEGRGFLNLHGKPIGGHLRIDACRTVAFVTRHLFGTPTRSVQFYSVTGACMFKVYLGRGPERQLIPAQVAAFEAAAARFAERRP